MKRILIYVLILAAALLSPIRGTDVGKLRPVEVVSIYKDEDIIIIETDTEDLGRGKTVAEAMRNLKETTAGIIYLDTADYLLVQKGSSDLIDEIGAHLKKEVRICEVEDRIDLKDAAEFLAVHQPNLKLKEWEESKPLQSLNLSGDKIILK